MHASNRFTTQEKRRRQFLLVLPLLVIPFLTLAFWALGGGKQRAGQPPAVGVNIKLPAAQLPDEKDIDRLSFYDKLKAVDKAPSTDMADNATPLDFRSYQDSAAKTLYDPLPNSGHLNLQSTQNAVQSKLQTLQELVDKKSSEPQVAHPLEISDAAAPALPPIATDSNSDKELDRLSGMLDKIIRIQHPDKEPTPGKHADSSVSPRWPLGQQQVATSVLTDTAGNSENGTGFLGIETAVDNTTQSGIPAQVETQGTISEGSLVRLRLSHAVSYGPYKLEQGQWVYGIATLAAERIHITVGSIRIGEKILKVNWEVYDLDGIKGISVPGAFAQGNQQVAADRLLQSMAFSSLDPGIAAQAASAGIETAKNLLSKKVKRSKLFIPLNYQVLLVNQNSQQ
jgi:conjugative transposon TraM protein